MEEKADKGRHYQINPNPAIEIRDLQTAKPPE
jgi:hypothetical protein